LLLVGLRSGGLLPFQLVQPLALRACCAMLLLALQCRFTCKLSQRRKKCRCGSFVCAGWWLVKMRRSASAGNVPAAWNNSPASSPVHSAIVMTLFLPIHIYWHIVKDHDSSRKQVIQFNRGAITLLVPNSGV
jgi:hypothetical protein